jgi:hypothetical protein
MIATGLDQARIIVGRNWKAGGSNYRRGIAESDSAAQEERQFGRKSEEKCAQLLFVHYPPSDGTDVTRQREASVKYQRYY